MHDFNSLVQQAVSFELNNEEETCVFASRLASCLSVPLVLAFSGDLGAGKTTLIRAMLRSLGVTGAIKSPTFSLVESYALPAGGEVHHFDLYRIHDDAELDYIGFRDYFSSDALCCIEWPERSAQLLLDVDLLFSIKIQERARYLTVFALSLMGVSIISSLLEAS